MRAAARCWDDVREGEELPGFSLELTATRMVLQVSGNEDVYPVHHDQAFARSAGHADIFVNTAFIRGCRAGPDRLDGGGRLPPVAAFPDAEAEPDGRDDLRGAGG